MQTQTAKRIARSLKSRTQYKARRWEVGHFEQTLSGRRIARLKDTHKSEACVIVGNGPSLRAEDLQKIHELDVPTFGTNRVFKIFDSTDWRPTYYVSEDVKVLRDVQREIEKVPACARFIPINLKWDEGVDIRNARYFYLKPFRPAVDGLLLSVDAAHGVICRSTVTVTCIQLAMYMGFSKIYLIGVDHNFAKMIDRYGNVIEDNSIKDHFAGDYSTGIPNEGFSVDDATEAYMDAERLSRRMGTCRIFNATRGGKLEVFERVDLDKLLAKPKEEWQ